MLDRILEPEVMDDPSEALAYDRMDHSEVNRIFVDDWARSMGRNPPLGAHILDVGCGTGLIPIELARKFPELKITGTDLAQSMLKLGREHLRRLGLGGRIELVLGDAKQMAFQNETFFAVISNSIIHHIPNPLVCLGEMVRVCKKGGCLFVRDLLRPESLDDLNRLVGLYAANAEPEQKELFAASLHAALTVKETRDLVGKLGFKPETVQQTSDRHWTWIGKKER